MSINEELYIYVLLCSQICVTYLMVVTNSEAKSHPLNETEISAIFKKSRMTADNGRAGGRFTDDAGGGDVRKLQSGSERDGGLSKGEHLESTSYVPEEARETSSEKQFKSVAKNKSGSSHSYQNSEVNLSQERTYSDVGLVMLNDPENNSSETLDNLSDGDLLYADFIDENVSSGSNYSPLHNEMNVHDAVTDKNDVNFEDIHLLFVKDDELNRTLMNSWNETELFLSSGELAVGQNAINLLRKYVEKRGTWLRRIKHVSQTNKNKTSVLLDGTAFEYRKAELKEMISHLKKLANVYRLATLVSAMHEFERKEFSFKHNGSTNIGSWMHEAETYLKKFEDALQDLEGVWKEYNTSGHFMFPWYNTYELMSKRQCSLVVTNETTKNATNQFEKLETVFRYYVYPCVYFTVVTIGVIGNGTLLLMFARHKEIRTGPNVMVLNLAVTDVVNLFINTPLYYVSKFYSEWIYLEGYGCKMFVIFRFAVHSVLAFSIVALSIQRYCASTPTFRRVSQSWGISSRLKTFIYVSSVWIAALLCGVPTAVVFQYKNGVCFPYVKYQIAVEILDIFYFILFVFFLPITMIVFSLLTARSLKMSIRSIPGVVRNSSQEVSRYRSAKVVVSLAIAYSISHIPRSIWFFMLTFFHFSRRENMYVIFVDEITNYLMFSNSCLNPVALYLASASFRRLFKLYLCRSVRKSKGKPIPLNRQSTASSSNSRLMSITETFSSDFNVSKSSLFDKCQILKEEGNDTRVNNNPIP